MLYRPLLTLSAAIVALGTGAVAGAQAPAAAAAAAPKPVPRTELVREINANYKAVDTNGDGAVTSAEIAAAQSRVQKEADALFIKRRGEAFAKLDTNKDGQLSAPEFNAGAPVPQRNLPAPAQVLGQLDTNKDQKVTVAEFSAAPLANFDRVDANRDGTASVDEQQKARAPQR